jgi:hypothetical protein
MGPGKTSKATKCSSSRIVLRARLRSAARDHKSDSIDSLASSHPSLDFLPLNGHSRASLTYHRDSPSARGVSSALDRLHIRTRAAGLVEPLGPPREREIPAPSSVGTTASVSAHTLARAAAEGGGNETSPRAHRLLAILPTRCRQDATSRLNMAEYREAPRPRRTLDCAA